MIESIHIFFGFSSLAFGPVVLLRPKGTPIHRIVGRLYVASMFGLNITAFGIYSLFGAFGGFHWLALISLATTVAGLVTAMRRKGNNNWLARHYEYMGWSYVGLLAATNNELFVHVYPLNEMGQSYPALVQILTFAVIAVGGFSVYRRREEILKI